MVAGLPNDVEETYFSGFSNEHTHTHQLDCSIFCSCVVEIFGLKFNNESCPLKEYKPSNHIQFIDTYIELCCILVDLTLLTTTKVYGIVVFNSN